MKIEDIDFFILDEADEMLNMGFREDIESILADKEKFLQLVTNGAADSELTQKQIYLKKNILFLIKQVY